MIGSGCDGFQLITLTTCLTSKGRILLFSILWNIWQLNWRKGEGSFIPQSFGFCLNKAARRELCGLPPCNGKRYQQLLPLRMPRPKTTNTLPKLKSRERWSNGFFKKGNSAFAIWKWMLFPPKKCCLFVALPSEGPLPSVINCAGIDKRQQGERRINYLFCTKEHWGI